MSETLDRLTERTVQAIEHLQEAASACLDRMEPAGELLSTTFLHDGKVLVCGNGPSAASAQLLSSYLLHRFSHDRPALPAINLSNNSALITQIGVESSINDVFAKPIQALAQPQDLLVIFDHGSKIGNLVQAVQAAHNRGLRVLAFTSQDGEDIASVLTPDDIELAAPQAGARTIEAHTLMIHLLCELIDLHIFGTED